MNAIQEFFMMILVVILILLVLGFGFYIVDETIKESNRQTTCATVQYYYSLEDQSISSYQKLDRMYSRPYTICK